VAAFSIAAPIIIWTSCLSTLRVDEQHRQVLEEIRTGVLCLPPPTPSAPSVQTKSVSQAAIKNAAQQETLLMELLNPKSWLAGKRVTLQLRVTDAKGHPVTSAKIAASVSGAAEPTNFFAESAPTGEANIAFDMPRLSDPNASLIIEAARGPAKGQLRFKLSIRQRVPVA
jgi:hypothetical protein